MLCANSTKSETGAATIHAQSRNGHRLNRSTSPITSSNVVLAAWPGLTLLAGAGGQTASLLVGWSPSRSRSARSNTDVGGPVPKRRVVRSGGRRLACIVGLRRGRERGRQRWRFTDEPSASSPAFVVAGAGAVLMLTAQPAAAVPTDTVLPIPIVGFSITPLPYAGAGYVVASTDPETPGVTRLKPASRFCCVFIHWGNLSTGAADTVYLDYPSVDARTGSGVVVATVTVPEGPPGYLIATVLPGAGGWTVP